MAVDLVPIDVERAEELLPTLEQARLWEPSALIEVMCSADCPPSTDFVGR